ncbi:MAG TPA: transposase [Aridibacter sp.]|nr:transposase [Aridibacter sp.]
MPDIDGCVFRKNSIRLSPDAYDSGIHFVTIAAKERKPCFADESFARACKSLLLQLREKRQFNLYSYTFRPDHFHGLIGIGDSDSNLGKICGEFKSMTTREWWKKEKGKLWQRQYYDHVIRSIDDLWETVSYIRDNPVKSDLVDRWDKWEHYGEPDLSLIIEPYG